MSGAEASGPSLAARAGIRAVRGYQYLAAATPSRCRFHPTCSQYTIEAIAAYGLARGILMERGESRVATHGIRAASTPSQSPTTASPSRAR